MPHVPLQEEMQIAIEEQHGANPLYTYANVSCAGATTADFDFQMDYLPKVRRKGRGVTRDTPSPPRNVGKVLEKEMDSTDSTPFCNRFTWMVATEMHVSVVVVI